MHASEKKFKVFAKKICNQDCRKTSRHNARIIGYFKRSKKDIGKKESIQESKKMKETNSKCS